MSAESPGQKGGFKSLFTNALRSKKSRQTLRKGSRSTTDLRLAACPSAESPPPMPDLAPLQVHREKYRQVHANVDSQLGERRDYTTMIHSLGLLDPVDSYGPADEQEEHRPPGEKDIAKLSSRLWARIILFLDPADAACLAFTTTALYRRLGPRYFIALDAPQNRISKLDFLSRLNYSLPHHILCFPCAKYHRRTQEGLERLRPAHVLNPLYNCANAYNSLNPPPRHRITHGRLLPFSFVQLVMRARRFGPRYGIPVEDMEIGRAHV